MELDNPTRVKSRLNEADVQVIDLQALNTMKGSNIKDLVNAVNESGLYDVVLDSRKPEAKEYINIISQKENIPFENLVRTTQGGRYKGTWLHNRLALAFARWCSAEFEYELDRWIECRIKDEHQRKLHRRELKTGYLPLTDAVQAAHEKDESHNYSNEANLINRLVTGMTAKKFKVTYNVKNVRDALTAAQAQLMNKVQRHNSVLIEMGINYHERKWLLQQLVDRTA